MFEEWLETVEMLIEATYGETLEELIQQKRVCELRMLYEAGVSEHEALNAIADAAWL